MTAARRARPLRTDPARRVRVVGALVLAASCAPWTGCSLWPLLGAGGSSCVQSIDCAAGYVCRFEPDLDGNVCRPPDPAAAPDDDDDARDPSPPPPEPDAPPVAVDDAGVDADPPDAPPDPPEPDDAGLPPDDDDDDAGVVIEPEPLPVQAVPFGYAPVHFTVADVLPTVGLDASCGPVLFDTTELELVNLCPGAPQPRMRRSTQPDGSPIVVVEVTTLRIAAGGALGVFGEAAAVFAVYGDAQIDGLLTADARGRQPGPGGDDDDACELAYGSGALEGTRGGGGGGGFAAAGGSGGRDDADHGSASGGGVAGDPTLSTLRGGCAGGNGSGPWQPGRGGGGGGAVQISAAGQIQMAGTTSARGGGGEGGVPTTGGGGGGSGGAIYLEAPLVSVSGALVANGGGGGEGGGDSSSGTHGDPGADGTWTTLHAPGGSGGALLGGDGGRGNAAGERPTDGAAALYADAAGGGGGGAPGRIAVRAGECVATTDAVLGDAVMLGDPCR